MEENPNSSTTPPLIDLSDNPSMTIDRTEKNVAVKRTKTPIWKSPMVISMTVVLGTCLVVMMIAIIISVMQSRIIHKYKYDQKKLPQAIKKEVPAEQRDVAIHSQPRFPNSYEDDDPGDPEEMFEIASKLCSPDLDPRNVDDERGKSNNSDVLRAIKTMRELNQTKNSIIPQKVMNQDDIMTKLQECKKDHFTKNELFKGIMLATNGVLTDDEFNNICNDKTENNLRKSSDRTDVSDVVSMGIEEPLIVKKEGKHPVVEPIIEPVSEDTPFIVEHNFPKSIKNRTPQRLNFDVLENL